MKSDSDTHYNWRTRFSYQMIGTGIGGVGNKRTSGDHPNYSIVEISQNTKKSVGDLLLLKTPVADTSVKTSHMSKIMIN